MLRKIYLFIFAIWFMGCSDFLEQYSQDEVRPATVSDLEQILIGDGYREDHNFYYLTERMTDNIKSIQPSSMQLNTFEKNKWMYIWEKKMFDEDGGGYCADVWETPYKAILGCNLVLDYIDEMKGANELRENIRGEAFALRAWYYFHLVNLFGIAYNQGNPDVDLGVPLKVNAIVDGEFFERNTVGEVYRLIEHDLLEANRLLTAYKYDRNMYRITHLAAKAMLSRMYLYMEDWDNALAYADSVLVEKRELIDFNNNPSSTFPYDIASEEIIWVRKYATGWTYAPPLLKESFPVSDDLPKLYGVSEGEWGPVYTDIRGKYYLQRDLYFNTGENMGIRKGIEYDYGVSNGIRTAELYLNRAEAYIRKYLKDGNDEWREKALADLNALRKNRIETNYYEEVNIMDGQELLQFCLDERRRELCGESCHRWGDLRRLGMTVIHKLYDSGYEYKQDMKYYVLPIPKRIREQNPALVQN